MTPRRDKIRSGIQSSQRYLAVAPHAAEIRNAIVSPKGGMSVEKKLSAGCGGAGVWGCPGGMRLTNLNFMCFFLEEKKTWLSKRGKKERKEAELSSSFCTLLITPHDAILELPGIAIVNHTCHARKQKISCEPTSVKTIGDSFLYSCCKDKERTICWVWIQTITLRLLFARCPPRAVRR